MSPKFLILFATVIFASSCTGPTPIAGSTAEVPKGRCVVNRDCPPGFRCQETFCQDIYYPERRPQ